jgi:subtilisin
MSWRPLTRCFALLVHCAVAGGLYAQGVESTAALVEQLQRHGGRVIVGLRPAGSPRGMTRPGVRGLSVADATRLAERLGALGFTPERHFRVITAVSGTVAPGSLRALRSHPNVEYVQPDYLNRLDADVVETVVETTPYGITTIRAPHAWAATTPPSYGAGVKVGILDTGGDPLHEDLRFAGGYDAINNSTAAADWADTLALCGGHGTHVAGTVAALRANGVGVVGVAPDVSLYALKFFEILPDRDGQPGCFGRTSMELAAFDWALKNGIQVINMSYGKPSYSLAEHQAIQAAVAQGVVFVAAAGNTSGPVIYPAANPEVIAVAATDYYDYRAWFSSLGPEVDVAAPGVDVYSTLPNNQYGDRSGTSMAAPHVTGLAALVRALKPSVTVAEVRNYITGWAVDLGPLGVDDEFGFGRVDAGASVTALIGPPPPTLLVTRQPGGALSGQPLAQQPAVQLVDADTQPIARSGVPVSATIVSGTGWIWMSGQALRAAGGPAGKGPEPVRLQAAATVTDATGTATFTTLTITGLGPHVLQFSAPGHTPVNSQAFTVTLPPPQVLTDGVAVTGVSGAAGSWQYWMLTVPPEAVGVTFTTGDGWGDVDLYVRRGALPDYVNWACASWSYTTVESCQFAGDVAGDWYVMLDAYTDFGGVTLLGDWQAAQAAHALGLTQQPGGAPAGQLLHPQPVVELRDIQGQPVHQAGVTVTVSADRSGILIDATPPVLAAVTDAQGRAAFDGLAITDHGDHVLSFAAPGLLTVTASVTVSHPLPPVDGIAAELLGSDQLSLDQEAYLDALGNADGVFNLGDFLAFLDRAGSSGSASVRDPRHGRGVACQSAGGGSAACVTTRRARGNARLP